MSGRSAGPGVNRRAVLLGMGAAALLAPVAHAQPAAVAGDFTLERVLVRWLSDGNQIRVTRRWAIVIGPSRVGAMGVSGAQSFVQVDAPPPLKAIADLEARREETGFLPLHLDESGRILSANEDEPAPLPEEALAAAVAFARSRASGGEVVSASRQFVADMSQSGQRWLTRLPRDLFFPAPREREASQAIDLPDGTSGTVTMREVAVSDPASGLLRSFQREAETSSPHFSRKGGETWRLMAAVS